MDFQWVACEVTGGGLDKLVDPTGLPILKLCSPSAKKLRSPTNTEKLLVGFAQSAAEMFAKKEPTLLTCELGKL